MKVACHASVTSRLSPGTADSSIGRITKNAGGVAGVETLPYGDSHESRRLQAAEPISRG